MVITTDMRDIVDDNNLATNEGIMHLRPVYMNLHGGGGGGGTAMLLISP